MRGENIGIVRNVFEQVGTSPRARGKRFEFHDGSFPCRNIPACAGKTEDPYTLNYLLQEHPRVRGENLSQIRLVPPTEGTSPRARGKHLLTCGSSFLMAILHSVLFFCTAGDSMESP